MFNVLKWQKSQADIEGHNTVVIKIKKIYAFGKEKNSLFHIDLEEFICTGKKCNYFNVVL